MISYSQMWQIVSHHVIDHLLPYWALLQWWLARNTLTQRFTPGLGRCRLGRQELGTYHSSHSHPPCHSISIWVTVHCATFSEARSQYFLLAAETRTFDKLYPLIEAVRLVWSIPLYQRPLSFSAPCLLYRQSNCRCPFRCFKTSHWQPILTRCIIKGVNPFPRYFEDWSLTLPHTTVTGRI